MRAPFGLLSGRDLALDVGTAHTRIGLAGERILVEAPSRPACAPGAEPALAHGVVRDVDGVARLLRPLLRDARGPWPARPRVLAFTPSHASDQERQALVAATHEAGGGQVALLPEPLAAAVGASLDLSAPQAQLLVDVGEGVTDVALFRGGRLERGAALSLGCGELRGEVVRRVDELLGVHLESERADGLLRKLAPPGPGDGLGLAVPSGDWRGARCASTAGARLRIGELGEAVDPLCGRLAAFVEGVARSLDPHAGAEVIESGLVVTGGGALLPRLTARLRSATRLELRVADDPLHAVIRGACRLLPQARREGLWAQ